MANRKGVHVWGRIVDIGLAKEVKILFANIVNACQPPNGLL